VKRTTISPEFVEYIPKNPEDGILYISSPFRTMVHRCCCGCGSKIITKLSPDDWKLIFDGEAVSLHPSIGNWSYACESHYWIRRNQVDWAPKWTKAQVDAGRRRDQGDETAPEKILNVVPDKSRPRTTRRGPWAWLRRHLSR
jgi:hypothetical protein